MVGFQVLVVLGHKSTSCWVEAARFKVWEAFNGRPPCSSATTTSVSRLRSRTKDDVTNLLFSGYASEGCPSLASFLVDFGLMFFGQEVHYYMVYIAYFTELNSKIWDYAQKRRICRENCKYALDERFHGLPSPATLNIPKTKLTPSLTQIWYYHDKNINNGSKKIRNNEFEFLPGGWAQIRY